MYRDWWALRSGDLRPEQASTLDFSPQFCEKLKSDSLLRADAHAMMTAGAFSAVPHDFRFWSIKYF